MGFAPRLEPGDMLQDVLREKFNRLAEEVESLGKLESDSGLIAVDDMGTGKMIRWTGPKHLEFSQAVPRRKYFGAFAVAVEAVRKTGSDGAETTEFKATVLNSMDPDSGRAGILTFRLPGATSSVQTEIPETVVTKLPQESDGGEETDSGSESAGEEFENVAGKWIYLVATLHRGKKEENSSTFAWRIDRRFEAAVSDSSLSCRNADDMTYWKRLAFVNEDGSVVQEHLTGNIEVPMTGYFNSFKVACFDGTVSVYDGGDVANGFAGNLTIGERSYGVKTWESADALNREIHLVVRAASEDDQESLPSGAQLLDDKYVVRIEAASGSSDLSTDGNPASWHRLLGRVDAKGNVRQVHCVGDVEIPIARWL